MSWNYCSLVDLKHSNCQEGSIYFQARTAFLLLIFQFLFGWLSLTFSSRTFRKRHKNGIVWTLQTFEASVWLDLLSCFRPLASAVPLLSDVGAMCSTLTELIRKSNASCLGATSNLGLLPCGTCCLGLFVMVTEREWRVNATAANHWNSCWCRRSGISEHSWAAPAKLLFCAALCMMWCYFHIHVCVMSQTAFLWNV